MTTEGSEHDPGRGDAELIAAVRLGDVSSFDALYERHSRAALVVARQYTDSGHDAEDVVADSFTAVYSALQGGHGPTEAFRAYLFTVVRRVATVHRTRGRKVLATDDVATLEVGSVPMAGADDPALAGFEHTVVARAFASLPERWRMVLWHSEVEGLAPAEIAPLLGLTANTAAALAYRAREGLRQAYLTEHLATPLDEACRTVSEKLGPYVRGGLGPRDTAKVEDHVAGCARCSELLVELGDVNHGMRAVVGPLILGIAGISVAKGLSVGLGVAAGFGVAAGSAVGVTGGAGIAGAAGAGAAGAGVTAGAGGAGTAAAGAGAGSGASSGGSSGGLIAAAAVGVVAIVAAAAFAISHLTSPPPVASPTPHASPPAASAPAASTSSAVPPAVPVPTTVPDPVATTEPVSAVVAPVIMPAAVSVDLAQSMLVLQAGVQNQELRLVVQNTGGVDASDVSAEIAVPAGVTVAAVADGGVSPVHGYAVPRSTAWQCSQVTSAEASCLLPRLAPGTMSVLVLRVTVDESFSQGSLAIDIAGDGLTGRATVPVSVLPSPARLEVLAQSEPVTLVGGGETQVTFTGRNVGGQTAAAAVWFDLPEKVHLAGVSAGWACRTVATTTTCTSEVAARSDAMPLALRLRAEADATPFDGELVFAFGPAPTRATVAVPVTVLRPATVDISLPATVSPLAAGRQTSIPVTVRNSGGVGSEHVTVGFDLPQGVVLVGVPQGQGWECTDTDCGRDSLPPGGSDTFTIVVTADTGSFPSGTGRVALGDLTVKSLAGDADGSATVALSAERPTLTIVGERLGLRDTNTGSVEVQVQVAGADATKIRAEAQIPDGLSFVSGPAGCVPNKDLVLCDLPDTAAGNQTSLEFVVRADAIARTTAIPVTVSATGAAETSGSVPVVVSAGGLAPRFTVTGDVDVTQVGAPLLWSDQVTPRSMNNDLDMAPLDMDPAPGARPTVAVSSSTVLTVPDGRHVVWAGLYWSANRGAADEWSTEIDQARLKGPGGQYESINGTVIAAPNALMYQSYADVTDQVAAAGAGTWSVADTAVATTRTEKAPNYYAGWALVVVYGTADPNGSHTVEVFDGGRTSGTATPFTWATTPGSTATLGTIAWEGDTGSGNDRLEIDGVPLIPVSWNGSPGSACDVFDSTAFGWSGANSLGVDAKPFLPVPLAANHASLTQPGTGDWYLLGAVTVRGDLP